MIASSICIAKSARFSTNPISIIQSGSKSRSDSKPRTLGNYEVHMAWEGFASIRQISSGEIMHSRTPPMEEARKLYVEQSNLADRVFSSPRTRIRRVRRHLVIWDVGLGAAANAMAAIHCYEEQAAKSSGSPAEDRQLRKRSRFAPARLPASPVIFPICDTPVRPESSRKARGNPGSMRV